MISSESDGLYDVQAGSTLSVVVIGMFVNFVVVPVSNFWSLLKLDFRILYSLDNV